MSAVAGSLRGARTWTVAALLLITVAGPLMSACGPQQEPGTLAVTMSGPAGPFAPPQSRAPSPMGGETITVNRGEEQVASGTTAADGTVTFDLPPGEYTVRDGAGCQEPTVVRLAEKQTANVEIVCNRL